MSTLKTNNVQVGQSLTATNNFTLYQPATPDGTVRLGVGNSGATTADVITANSSGNVGIGTSSPAYNLDIARNSNKTSIQVDSGNNGIIFTDSGGTRYTIGSSIGVVAPGNYLAFNYYSGSTWSERARIDSSGNWYMNSGFGSSAIAYGCRAWVNFNGSGTVAIRASGNVSSITDNGTGDFTVNFATAMSDANFSGVVSNSGVVNVAHTVCFLGSPGSNDTSSHPNSSSFRFSFYSTTNSGARGDPVMANVSVFR